MANLMKEAGCSDVQIEPPLLPVNPYDLFCGGQSYFYIFVVGLLVVGHIFYFFFFRSRTNTTYGARLDISARGLQSAFEHTFFDVRVSHPYAASNVTVSLPALYDARNEKEKRSLYQDGVLENEKGSFDHLTQEAQEQAAPRL